MNRQQRRQEQRALRAQRKMRQPSNFVVDDNKQYSFGSLIFWGKHVRALVSAGLVSMDGVPLRSPGEMTEYVLAKFPELTVRVRGEDETAKGLERGINQHLASLRCETTDPGSRKPSSQSDKVEQLDLSPDHYYEVAGLTLNGEQLQQLIQAGFISKDGTPLQTVAEMLYYLWKVFPDLKLRSLPDEKQNDEPDNYFEDQMFPIVHNENNIADDNDETQDAILRARIIVQTGVEAKRRGDYKAALERYEEAVRVAPGYLDCYYSLGKLHYLLNDKEASLLYYTVAAHLHASSGGAQDLNDDLREKKEAIIASFPNNVVDQFRSVHRQATLLLVDNNTPKHVGHTFVDLPISDDLPPNIQKAANSYRAAIAGKSLLQLDDELEAGLYHTTGAAYLLQRIQWSRVGKHPVEDVCRLYSDATSSSVSESSCETQLRWALGELEQPTGLRRVNTTTPFSRLVDELDAVWRAENATASNDFQTLSDQAFQAAKKLISNPYDMTTGPLILTAMIKRDVSEVSMIKRWEDSIKLVQTPLIDFFFMLNRLARQSQHRTPILSAIIYVMKDRDLINLRNGLVHETYQWEMHDILYLNILDGTRVISRLTVSQCEAFHALICVCALALERIMTLSS